MPISSLVQRSICLAGLCCLFGAASASEIDRPNIVFVLTDDHRWDCYGAGRRDQIRTPRLDRIADRGVRFENAFVTLAICSPSRAACLTGRYGSANGVTAVGKLGLNLGERTFAHALRDAGYATGVAGKWHLKTRPEECGFDFVSTCWSNGTWYDRQFTIDGEKRTMRGFVDDVTADESIRFIRQSQKQNKPFVLWICTQAPHMDHNFSWPAKQQFLDSYEVDDAPLARSWNDDLAGKPEYLKTSRNRTKALEYGYDDPQKIRKHARDYYASVTQMDAAVGRVLDVLDEPRLSDNTWIIFMGDNGWMLGEHGMTSKVLPYEESMRVPMAICGPATKQQVLDDLVLNIDLTATIYDLAGLSIPGTIHGRSLLPFIQGDRPADWRNSFLYEAPTPQLGSQPLWAVRNKRWKYVQTKTDSDSVFEELYDLQTDPIERVNVADAPAQQKRVTELAQELVRQKTLIAKPDNKTKQAGAKPRIPSSPPPAPRTDLFISGVYPHLTTYGVYSQNGAHYKSGHNECGIGAIVPWAGKLWMVNYAPHMPKGSEHKLFSVDPDVTKPMTVHPESVGGTPAGRMIHAESNQLLIAHHLIDDQGNVRTISPKDMPIRVTALARHLKDPANMVYYIDMEGSIWEADVHTLAVKRLFKKPVPGWHGKGGYTSQGRLVISNNGELHVGGYDDLLVGGEAKNEEERGVLAEYDGNQWRVVERRQYTEVTGPKGITGGSDGDDPIWTMGWDRRTVRLKVLADGKWSTYLLPKAAFCNDAYHGWYTEWPRIREITDGRMMMDMHGMFFDLPKTFSSKNTSGLRPIGSHLRYIPDFCEWNGRLVLATDETSIQGNPLAGQPQANLWFGEYSDLKNWGPASGYGGPWIGDAVKANTPSDPFLVAGFDRRILHLAAGKSVVSEPKHMRVTGEMPIAKLPARLSSLPLVTVPRGDWRKPGVEFSFSVDKPTTIYLSVDSRGKPNLGPKWKPTDMSLTWKHGHGRFKDVVFAATFSAGNIQIPANAAEHTPGAFGMPHAAFVQCGQSDLKIKPAPAVSVTTIDEVVSKRQSSDEPVVFKVEIDTQGTGNWAAYGEFSVPANGYVSHLFPRDFEASWLRLLIDRDSVVTAVMHQTSDTYADPAEGERIFAGLADATSDNARGALLYAAKRNRNLRVIADGDQFFEFGKSDFEFTADKPDTDLAKLLHVEPEFKVDDASVVLKHDGHTLRLPKGSSAFDKPFGKLLDKPFGKLLDKPFGGQFDKPFGGQFDKPFGRGTVSSGWPRDNREVESERHLANIHGTFYEVPLLINGKPPAFNLMRPVASHNKQITDYCTWNGLLVLAGVREDAQDDGHVFVDPTKNVGLWFGGIDDLWKFGKPIGVGGPWKNTQVDAGSPSDPYLMTGYDSKSLKLSSDTDTTITIEVDIDHQTGFHTYREIEVPAGQEVSYQFPTGFSAHWIRFRSRHAGIVSAQLTYR